MLLPFETVWVLSLQSVSPRAALPFQHDPRPWGLETEHALSVDYISLLINPLLPITLSLTELFLRTENLSFSKS